MTQTSSIVFQMMRVRTRTCLGHFDKKYFVAIINSFPWTDTNEQRCQIIKKKVNHIQQHNGDAVGDQIIDNSDKVASICTLCQLKVFHKVRHICSHFEAILSYIGRELDILQV